MASNIDTTRINSNYPIAGQNNTTQGFRDNFANIKAALNTTRSEINEIHQKALFKTAVAGTTLANDLNWNSITRAQLRSYSETFVNHGSVSGVVNIDYIDGTIHKLTLTNNILLSFAGFPPVDQVGRVILWFEVTNTAHTATLPAAVTYGLNNIHIVNKQINFPTTGDFLLEIASADNGLSYWVIDFANLGGSGGGGLPGATGATGLAGPVGATGVLGVYW